MAYVVHGPFETVKNAAEEVTIIGLKGYKAEDIHVIAKEDLVSDLKENADADIIGVLQESDTQQIENLHQTLQEYEMSEEQIKRYEEALKDHHIIIVLNTDDIRMGNEPETDTDVMEEDFQPASRW